MPKVISPQDTNNQPGVEEFVAWVPYNGDWVGTVCAEDLDSASLRSWLVNGKMVEEKDIVCGIRVYQGQVSVYVYRHQNKRPYLDALQSSKPIPLKEIELEISVYDLLCKFHKLEILFALRSGLDKKGISNKRFLVESRRE